MTATEPVTLSDWGDGLVTIHQGRVAIRLTPEQADQVCRDLRERLDSGDSYD